MTGSDHGRTTRVKGADTRRADARSSPFTLEWPPMVRSWASQHRCRPRGVEGGRALGEARWVLEPMSAAAQAAAGRARLPAHEERAVAGALFSRESYCRQCGSMWRLERTWSGVCGRDPLASARAADRKGGFPHDDWVGRRQGRWEHRTAARSSTYGRASSRAGKTRRTRKRRALLLLGEDDLR
jgi:hypothetical protein